MNGIKTIPLYEQYTTDNRDPGETWIREGEGDVEKDEVIVRINPITLLLNMVANCYGSQFEPLVENVLEYIDQVQEHEDDGDVIKRDGRYGPDYQKERTKDFILYLQNKD